MKALNNQLKEISLKKINNNVELVEKDFCIGVDSDTVSFFEIELFLSFDKNNSLIADFNYLIELCFGNSLT